MTSSDLADTRRPNFGLMLVGLAILLLTGPVLRALGAWWSPLILWLTLGVAIGGCALSLSRATGGRTAGLMLALAVVLGGGVATASGLAILHTAATVVFLAFCTWAIAVSLRLVLTGPNVDLNRIAGSICVYVLMGVLWTVLYALLALYAPDAFKGLHDQSFDKRWDDLLYFSFVTMTTLGYGDITPILPLARTLAYLQAMVGQLYIAVLIAGLVGAHLGDRPL